MFRLWKEVELNTMKTLLVNGNTVSPNRRYSLSEAARIVGKSKETLYNAVRRTDSRHLQAGVARSNGRLCVTGVDLYCWAVGLITESKNKTILLTTRYP